MLDIAEIRELLERKSAEYNTPLFIETDPVSVPHLFRKQEDREIAGFFAATLAWGQRKTIINNALKLMLWMDYSPHDFILNHSRNDLAYFQHFVHRTFNGSDCVFFITALRALYKEFGTMEAAFTPEQAENNQYIKYAISAFRKRFLQISHPVRSEKHLADPFANAAAKRLNMFLRWMVRKDDSGVDFGIWKSFSPARLMIPLDLHTGKTARQLGLLHRHQNDWKAVEELTTLLRSFDPLDPVKYDYALFGMSIALKKRE